ncbi:uncharacterized protein LOC115444741 [Manduca sexta]|uniref:Shavenoid isoform B-like N-terminal domain-containing protein n=1 Tax=Manduca sexta TaxID=7130 RepID=A0A921Z6W3_MANSE|nr:uncharacterized protein LOC115444741 [Manduca sexta]KAG6452005.1 hypothetical protein O3G_MSEX007427 [Manduca sexta]
MAAALLLLATVASAASVTRLGELARRDTGDIFTLVGGECNAAQCAEHSAWMGESSTSGCACACPQRAPLFREDRELCVDDLPECALATFGTGAGVQRIPFVYLPLKGQIIHPSKEITFQNVKTPICAVSGAQFLTRKGFLDLRNTLDADVPFNLFRDEGRTFLQWSGEDDVRARMSGRVMVVRLLCRDVSAPPSSPLDLRGVFTPCVAFRVQGTPPIPSSNVTEVQFASNAHRSETATASGLSVTEYVAIGISSLLLGLIYVASVFLFLHLRKRRKATSDGGSSRKLQGLKKRDGSLITERDIVRVNNERLQILPNNMRQDDGIIKSNPLLNISRQYHESKSYPNDSGSNLSDSEDFADSSIRSDENLYNCQTISAIIHQHRGEMKMKNDNAELSHRDESGIERLPDEHVSIVETTDDREIARPVGTTRRKLYFNPAYFEPQLMAEPPAAALEFLVKIREVIAIAKHKMAAKRFQPVLNEIPEEETFSSNGNSLDLYQRLGSQRSESVVSLKRENSRKKNCVGCPGCQTETTNDMQSLVKHNMLSCMNCMNNKGEKQNSIRKWLENIPTTKQAYNEYIKNGNQNNIANALLLLPATENRRQIRKHNSFSSPNSMPLTDDFMIAKKSGSMSVRSEPLVRNYNLPLPELDNIDFQHNNYNYYCQTIGQIDDISPIGPGEYRSDSLRYVENNQLRNKLMSKKNSLPDMVNEAIALEHCTKSFNQSSSDEERFLNSKIPTLSNQNPYTRINSESPSGNDYETDSLERNSNKKGISTPTEYTEISSSQASPSLSNALPLEEELTMRNAVYKTHSSSNSATPPPRKNTNLELNHYESIRKTENTRLSPEEPSKQGTDYSLVSEVYVNNNYNFGSTPTSPSGSECSLGSRKLNTSNINNLEEKPGCLTIEVKDSPENYIKIHESDGFEPDTLDRKHLKHKEHFENIQFSRKDLIKNLNDNDSPPRQRIQLRSSGTFKKTTDKVEYTNKFHSLRSEYEQRKNIYDRPKLSPAVFSGSKSLENNTDDTLDETSEWNTDEGRILTLELRHSKRQRQCTPPTIKQVNSLVRPDILPPLPPTEDDPIYEHPRFPPRRVDDDRLSIEPHQKKDNGRSLSPRTFMKTTVDETIVCDDSTVTPEPCYGSSCSPIRASAQSQSSEYENVDPVNFAKKTGDLCRSFNKRRSDRGGGRINTDTFVKGSKSEGKSRFRRKKGSTVQDSGYLSSDSTSSRQIQRKLVIAKIVSCSESDDTENEARSESGAESVETHSVFFGAYRKIQMSDGTSNDNSSRNSSRKLKCASGNS